ncbi:MAG: helix-turn-helix domain-containing protein [Verrucomicrobia bacterium]|nr:helix-turn-helix domain-containing protein [Verrucomicrobiota bacterium]
MQTIGERLEEARKRKGISLREAAEVTKIRSDYLSYLEQNNFDFDLPEIYRTGFIKNYARYLKLDADKIITDYNTQRLGMSRNKRAATEWFGSSETRENAESTVEQSYGTIRTKSPTSSTESETATEETASAELDKTFYLKIGLILSGALALVIILFGLVRAIIGSGADPEPAPTTTVEAQPAVPVSTTEFTIVANGGSSFVAARQVEDRKIIYQGTLADGESAVVQKQGAVEIVLTQPGAILIRNGSEEIRATAGSVGGSSKIRIP